MSDVIYNISSGFFDSVNGDRLYSAADMNKPYKRVIADGIFPTPQGTPSTDFQVVAVSGMSVAVLAGNAMIGARWAENTDDVGITIAGNSSSSPRIDSIFLHIDTGMDTRAAGVVYRQGTAAGTPTAPAMVQTDNITELRLADILVAPSAAIITQANITDQRGGSDCPWVAGLIQQVDTSALFDQYRAAYAEQQQDQADEWNTFMAHLARDYDISMSLRKHESTYTSTAAASLIPINIDGYDTTKDLLQVYINGIFAVEGTHYIVKSAAQIQLTNAISAGQKVHFVIYKAVMGGAQPIIPTDEQVQDAVDDYMDAHPGALVVDPELSDTSTHAIQNKAVAEALAGVNGRLGELYLTDNLQDAALWENGALNTGDGSTFQIDTRIVTKDWIPVSKGSTLTILNSYRFAYTVNSEPTVGTAYRLESKTLGQMVQAVTISHSGYIRVAIAPPSDTSVDVSIRSNLEANILSSRFDKASENIKDLDDKLEKTQSDVEVANSRINDVIKSSINLIDTDQNTKDYYINKNTGEVVTYVGWDASGYIPVKQTEYVAIFKGSNGWEYSPTIYMAFYDANKQYTHGMSAVPNAPHMQAVSGDAYARISYRRVDNPDIMFGTMEDLEGYIGTSKDRVLAGNYIEDDLNYKKLESLPVRIIMPDKVVALVDEQFDIHYDNVLCYGNIKTIPYKEMFGSSFASMENMARAQVATAGKGNNSLHMYSSVPSSFMASQLPSTVLKKVFVYKTIEKTSGAGITRNVLLIGDSTTAPGIYARELKALFEAETEPMNIRLLGTLGNGGAEVGAETGYHEGHGGYSCKTYCTTAYHNGYNNHFYNPTTQAFDFSYYMTYTGFTNIADVVIVMGINDVAAMEDYDEMMTYFRQMVTSIRSANSFDGQPARVFIALCIPPAEYEYSDMNNNSQRSKTRRLLLHERLIEEWGNRESEGFYIVPLNLSIDPEHDFKTEQRARSFRDQTMVTYCTDNVHPSAIAYNKMADRIRTYIKYAEI